jgi:hypothetical protein
VCQVLYFLSGLTCDDQTFIVKSNAQRKASEHGIALVTCDTSPRGLNIDGEEEDWSECMLMSPQYPATKDTQFVSFLVPHVQGFRDGSWLLSECYTVQMEAVPYV